MEINLDVSNVFERNYNARTRNVVNEGGSRSGKTYSILQLLIFIKATKARGLVISIVRKTLAELKATAMRDFLEILNRHNMYNPEQHNKSNQTYTYNGNIFEFIGLDKAQKKRGAKRDYLFINEANDLSIEDWIQLSMRTTNQIYIDYNPSFTEHEWIDQVIKRNDTTFIHSTYRDNFKFLPETVIKEIRQLKTVDPYYYKVYTQGLRAQIRGIVFEKITYVKKMPELQDRKWTRYGLDFGYTNDPTALIEVCLSGGELWIKEILYNYGLNNYDLNGKFQILDLMPNCKIIADSADPKSISELKSMGWKVEGAKKGADSIRNGIDIMKRYNLNITEGSTNLKKEFTHYKWKESKDGKATNEPIDIWNHGIDAIRYVCLNTIGHVKQNKAKYINT